MAKTTKKLPKTKTKTGILDKIKDLLPGQNALKRRAPKNVLKANLKTKSATKTQTKTQSKSQSSDPAHAPGHRRLNLKNPAAAKGTKNIPQNDSAMNKMAGREVIARKESPQRRIISGAALGKSGRRP